MRVLNLTTHDEACGIAKYQESFIDGLARRGHTEVESVIFDVSPNRIRPMGQAEYEATMQRFLEEAKGFDLVHVQHEFGFFSRDELVRVVDGVHALGKRVAFTVHTSPRLIRPLYPPRLHGLGPRSWVQYARELRHHRQLQRTVIAPLQKADLLIVHNQATKAGLIELGVDPSHIVEIVHPLKAVADIQPTDRIRSALNAGPGDVILCTVGFLHKFKGIDAAIKALPFLPDNYKLAVIGGINPTSDDVRFYDTVADLIRKLGLIDRVTITGYVEDDDELDALIRECDIAVYPYNPVYYDQVSSGALNISLANGMPTVAYPTRTFRELAAITDAVTLTKSANYYELARTVREVPVGWPNERALKFATDYSYERMSDELAEIYTRLAS